MLEGLPVVGLTAPALLGITVLLLLTGRLVPRSTLKDKADEANEWRDAYEKERESRTVADAQSRELLELAKTSNAFIAAVYKNSERIRELELPDARST